MRAVPVRRRRVERQYLELCSMVEDVAAGERRGRFDALRQADAANRRAVETEAAAAEAQLRGLLQRVAAEEEAMLHRSADAAGGGGLGVMAAINRMIGVR